MVLLLGGTLCVPLDTDENVHGKGNQSRQNGCEIFHGRLVFTKQDRAN